MNENPMWLRVAHCHDVKCTSATTSTVDPEASVSRYNIFGITVGGDGLPLILYVDAPRNESMGMKIAHCNNPDCSDVTISTLGYPASSAQGSITIDTSVGYPPSIAIGVDGFPLIVYALHYVPKPTVAHCSNVECTSSTVSTLDTDFISGTAEAVEWSVDIGSDGLGMIAYQVQLGNSYPRPKKMRVAHCSNTSCSAASTTTVLEVPVNQNVHPSMIVDPNGVPMILYTLSPPGSLNVLRCGSNTCQ
jgi:hypothetical protein